MFDGATVIKTADSGEHRADFVVRESDRFDHERTTAVQFKDHAEVLDGKPARRWTSPALTDIEPNSTASSRSATTW